MARNGEPPASPAPSAATTRNIQVSEPLTSAVKSLERRMPPKAKTTFKFNREARTKSNAAADGRSEHGD